MIYSWFYTFRVRCLCRGLTGGLLAFREQGMVMWGRCVSLCESVIWLGRGQPFQGICLEVGLHGRGLGTLCKSKWSLCTPLSWNCLHKILLLFGMDAGDSARLLLRGETSLEKENMVYYSCLLQRCLAGLLDAELNSERCCTDSVAESLWSKGFVV